MIVVFGSINLDLIFAVPRIPTSGETTLGPATRIEPGGKGANQALAAARDGARVIMAGAVGADSLAEAALALLRAEGVDLTRVRTTAASTGCAAIMVDAAGHNAIVVGSGANLEATAAQLEDGLLGPDTTLVLQREVPAAEIAGVIRRARQAGSRIVLNLAPAGPLPHEALRSVDVLVVNETEGTWLAGELGCLAQAASLRDALGHGMVVLTRGEAGADVADATSQWHEPAEPIHAVDTTAAGDCFVGVLAHGLDRGLSPRDAVRRASRAASLCCLRPGSQSSLPRAEETNTL